MTTTPEHYFKQYRSDIRSMDTCERSRQAARQGFRYTDHDYDTNPSNYSNQASNWKTEARKDLTTYLKTAANANKSDGKLDATELFWATGIHSTLWETLEHASKGKLYGHLDDPEEMAKLILAVDDNQNGELDYEEKQKLVAHIINDYREEELGIDPSDSGYELFDRMNNKTQRQREAENTVFGNEVDPFDTDDLRESAEDYLTEAAQSGTGDTTELSDTELMMAFGMSRQAITYLKACFQAKRNLDLSQVTDAKEALVILDEGMDGFGDGLLFKDQKDHIEKLAKKWEQRNKPNSNRTNKHCRSCPPSRHNHPSRRHNHDHSHNHRHRGWHCHTQKKSVGQWLLDAGGFLLQAYVAGHMLKGYAERTASSHRSPKPCIGPGAQADVLNRALQQQRAHQQKQQQQRISR